MRHGGDLISYGGCYGGSTRDFSSNINPLGYPERLGKAILGGMENLKTYPDIKYRRLKSAVSSYLGCKQEEVVVGNGAVEILHCFSMLFSRVIVCTPCFSEYIEQPLILGKEVVKLSLNQNFGISMEALGETIQEGDLLILGNPNNPTGRRLKKKLLLEIHSLIVERNAFLLLDEAFWEFCTAEDGYDSIELLRSSRNVCIIRAATKFFALPGIRLGYAFTHEDMALKYDSIALPWSVNAFAEIAGTVILSDDDYIARSRRYMEQQRNLLLGELRSIKKLIAYDTDCNFILLKLLKGNENELFDFLIQRGIMIRKASGFDGLDSSFVRIAVKSEEDNRYLVKCMGEYFRYGQSCLPCNL